MCPKLLIICLLVFILLVNLACGKTNYISHSDEPNVGDNVKNTNPKCLHFGSKGKVLSVSSLPDGMGKVVTYLVLNNGPTYSEGKTLTKTMDQLSPN